MNNVETNAPTKERRLSELRKYKDLTKKGQDNKIVSSKYTLLSFLPLNAYHQLSKPSTAFFFVTLILLSIPSISPFEPWSYLLAFVIVVGISMIKDGVEDYKRHKSDKQINEKRCYTIVGREKNEANDHENREMSNREEVSGKEDTSTRQKFDRDFEICEKLVMGITNGDWLLLKRNEEVPADVILMSALKSKDNSIICCNHCYVDTSNLDGESNLKKRTSPNHQDCSYTQRLRSIANDSSETSSPLPPYNPSDELCPCSARLFNSLDSFDLKETSDSFDDFQCDLIFDGRSILATEKHVLLRGSILKNTERALCLVVAVGNETKQRKSTFKARKGKSIFEKKMDHILLLVFFLYIFLLAVTTIVSSVDVSKSASYTGYNAGPVEVIKLLFTNYILYSYLIPLSLYVMIEVARFIHASYVKYDRNLKINGEKSICRNSNVIEDLGMVDYILSDKTGTITKNSMTLRAFHLNGDNSMREVEDFFNEQILSGSNSSQGNRYEMILGNIKKSDNETNKTDIYAQNQRIDNKSTKLKDLVDKTSDNKKKSVETKKSRDSKNKNSDTDNRSENEYDKVAMHKSKTDNLYNFDENIKTSDGVKSLMFVLNLLICNSVEVLNGKYEGISQDELSFLETIKERGFELIKRDENYVKIKLKNEIFKVDILYTLDFTSKRQSMETLLRLCGRYFLFKKGSDQKLLDRTREKDILDVINRSGDLRSLVFKYREVDEEEIDGLVKKIENKLSESDNLASLKHEKDEDKTKFFMNQYVKLTADDDMFVDIDRDMEYLGSTFIEDELQDDVKDTMKDLRDAGMRIWMVTGDKKETAVSCGRNSGIISGNDFIEIEGKQALEEMERIVNQERIGMHAGNARFNREADANQNLLNISTHSESNREEDANQPLSNNSINNNSQEIPDRNIEQSHLSQNNRNITGNTANSVIRENQCNRNPINHNNGNNLDSVTNSSNPENSSTNEMLNSVGNIFNAKSVIIYRATPSQKGRIAELMVNAHKHILAIGDGNNDVAMLKEAHVGVGIMGKEGAQASLAADFAVPEFKALKRLILVHGRYNLIRYSKICLNAFYKNIFFIFFQFFYNINNGGSGRAIYNDFFMNYYNLFFTSLIPFSISLFDRDIPERKIFDQPRNYRMAREYFNRRFIYMNIIFAIFEAAVLYYLLFMLLYWDISDGSGKIGGYSCISTIFSIVVFGSVILRQVRTISFFVVYNYIAITLSIVLILVMLFGVQELAYDINATIYHILGMPSFYLILLTMFSAAYLLDSAFELYMERISADIHKNRVLINDSQ